jgi:hypothetical protein
MTLQHYTNAEEYERNKYTNQEVVHNSKSLVRDYPFHVTSGALQKVYWVISSATSPPSDNSKIEVFLPVFFTNSMNKNKYIEVRHCKVIYDDVLVNDVKFHSDIVKEHPYDDHFICFTNEVLVKPRKYHWNGSDKSIKVWFSNMRNKPVEIIDFHIDILLMF